MVKFWKKNESPRAYARGIFFCSRCEFIIAFITSLTSRVFRSQNRRILYFIALAIIVWRGILFLADSLGRYVIQERLDFLGPIPWANFDGVHYLSIAQHGYFQYEQAFFPLFPLIIAFIASLFNGNVLVAALVIVHISLIVAMVLLWKVVRMDFTNKISVWTILFLLMFPTSFFFGSVYTESLFLAFVLGSFYAARKGNFFVASIVGGLATATKFVGIALLPALLWEWWEQKKLKMKKEKGKIFDRNTLWLLLIPGGLLSYMIYLFDTTGDPFAFIHVQPAFGANRTGGEIILLPQVLFRYVKIFLTVPWIEHDFRIAFLEVFMFSSVFGLLLTSWSIIRKSYLIFSFLSILVPTLTGTLSSMPRYVLIAFPIFIALAMMKYRLLRFLLALSFSLLLIILTALFTRGYFVG